MKSSKYILRRSETWHSPVLVCVPLTARHPVAILHPHSRPSTRHTPFRSFNFSLAQLEERWNSKREAQDSNPGGTKNQRSLNNRNIMSRFRWSRLWAVTSFFLKLIRGGRKTTLLFEKSRESLSVAVVHLDHHLSLATYIIQKAHKWTDSGRQWCHFTLTSYCIVNIESFTANGKTSI